MADDPPKVKWGTLVYVVCGAALSAWMCYYFTRLWMVGGAACLFAFSTDRGRVMLREALPGKRIAWYWVPFMAVALYCSWPTHLLTFGWVWMMGGFRDD